jgi:hypothetical protein
MSEFNVSFVTSEVEGRVEYRDLDWQSKNWTRKEGGAQILVNGSGKRSKKVKCFSKNLDFFFLFFSVFFCFEFFSSIFPQNFSCRKKK